MDALPDQEELRRRLRAARALRGLHVTDVAKLMPTDAKLSLSTLRKIEAGERKLDPIVLRELAAQIGVPYEWFTVPDVGAAVLAGSMAPLPDDLEGRVAAIERAQAEMWETIRSGALTQGAVRSVRPGEGRS